MEYSPMTLASAKKKSQLVNFRVLMSKAPLGDCQCMTNDSSRTEKKSAVNPPSTAAIPAAEALMTEVTPPEAGETVETAEVRFRTVGDMTCTCPVESLAATAGDIVIETLAADVSERGATRMDDKTSEASMEKRKKDGYF